jgi:hypothetical protein
LPSSVERTTRCAGCSIASRSTAARRRGAHGPAGRAPASVGARLRSKVDYGAPSERTHSTRSLCEDTSTFR